MRKNIIYSSFFRWLILMLLIIIAISELWFPILRMSYVVEINRNEVWNAYQAIKVVSGQPLYILPSLTPVNYPPFSFYLIGNVVRFSQDPVFTGRVISLFSLLGLALLAGYLVFLVNNNILDAFFVGTIIITFFCTLAPSYIAMNDPQFLAQFLMMAGLLSYWIFLQTKRKEHFFLMSFLIVLALFTKQNVLAVPLAISLHMYMFQRKFFREFLGLILGDTIILTLGLQFHTHGTYVSSLLLPRELSIAHFTSRTSVVFFLFILPLWPCLLWLAINAKNKNSTLYLFYLYLFFSLVIGLFFSFGVGANINMYFDFIISLALCIGIGLRMHARNAGLLAVKKAVYGYFFLYLLFFVSVNIFGKDIKNLQFQQNETAVNAAFLKKITGPALCDDLIVCYLAGKPFLFDPFLVSQMVVTHQIAEKTALAKITSRDFAIIEMKKTIPLDTDLDKVWRTTYQATVQANYHLSKTTQDATFYISN